MNSYLLRLEFDGTNYCGWQRQKNALSVGDVVFRATETLFGGVTGFSGCSRTDAGVHAKDFCVSFSAQKQKDSATVVRALNAALPRDIAVLSCQPVSSDFHARYSVREKEYEYRICTRPVRSVFAEGHALMYGRTLDCEQLNREAEALVGTHDFSSFMAAGSRITDAVRTVTRAYFEHVNGDETVFHIAADGFLYHMVRIVVGTLLEISEEKRPDLLSALRACDRSAAGRTAPAQGLYLARVTY